MLKNRSLDGINRLMAAVSAGQLQVPIEEPITEGDKIIAALPDDLKRLGIVIKQKHSTLKQLAAEHTDQHRSGNHNPAECSTFKKMLEEETADIKFLQDFYWREIKMCAGQSDNLAVKSSAQGDVIVELDPSVNLENSLDKIIEDFLRGPFGLEGSGLDPFSDDNLGFLMPGGRGRISLISAGDPSSLEDQPGPGGVFKSFFPGFPGFKLRR